MEHPYRDGVVLVGDARPPATPPTARAYLLLYVVRERFATNLLAIPIGKPQDTATPNSNQRSFHACHVVERWLRTLFHDPSPEAAALRARALPLIAEDSTRVPDHIFSGPDLPLNEQVRARFFGEC